MLHKILLIFGTLIRGVLFFVQSVLELGYWYTRTSTAFISVPGTIMIAASGIIAALAHVASSAETQKLNLSASQWFPWLWLILLTLVTRFSLPLLMLKTATRLEFAGSNGRTFHLVPPTHKERNSQRLDSRTSWAVKTGVSCSLMRNFSQLNTLLRSAFFYSSSTTSLPPTNTTSSLGNSHLLVRTTTRPT